MARFRAGDEVAFTDIHRRFDAALTTFARRMLGVLADDAEDVVQDAFLRAHVALRATNTPVLLRPWLYAIVRNRALDQLRAQRPHRSLDDAMCTFALPVGDPAERVAELEEVRHLVAEIGRLPERQRTALVMHALDGRSHVETARAMQTSVSATKSLVIRARWSLQAAMTAA